MAKSRGNKKKKVRKTLKEISKGANKIIGDNVHGGWVEVLIPPDEIDKEGLPPL